MKFCIGHDRVVDHLTIFGCHLVPQRAGMAEVIEVDLREVTPTDFRQYKDNLRKVRLGTGRNPYLKKSSINRFRSVTK